MKGGGCMPEKPKKGGPMVAHGTQEWAKGAQIMMVMTKEKEKERERVELERGEMFRRG